MVFLALILMAAAAIMVDYIKVQREKKKENIQMFESADLKHLPV